MRAKTTAVGVLTAMLALAMLAVAKDSTAASQASANLEVSAVVVANCRFTLTGLNFGSYDPLGAHQTADLDATATVALSCTRGSQAAISMNGGRAPVSGTALRALTASDSVLQYQIFRDSNRRDVWATGADALRFQATAAAGSRHEFIVYGRIPGGQEVAAGMYTDVVTATVDF